MKSCFRTKQLPFEILGETLIRAERDAFLAWPTVGIDAEGTLYIAYSGNRKRHVDPFGKNYLLKSADLGETWQEPILVYDSPLDDRDGGLLVLPDGTLLYTTFSSNYFKTHLDRLVKYYGPSIREEWKEHLNIEAEPTSTLLLSKDGGQTFYHQTQLPIDSCHGPILGLDGTIYYLGNTEDQLALLYSTNGIQWHLKAHLFSAKVLKGYRLCEPHLINIRPGVFLAMFRANNHWRRKRTIFMSWSRDGGVHWSDPEDTRLKGYPPHLLRLKSGQILLTYANRNWPYTVDIALSGDGEGWQKLGAIYKPKEEDMGYPSTVQLPDGSLYTVFYEQGVLRGVHFAL